MFPMEVSQDHRGFWFHVLSLGDLARVLGLTIVIYRSLLGKFSSLSSSMCCSFYLLCSCLPGPEHSGLKEALRPN